MPRPQGTRLCTRMARNLSYMPTVPLRIFWALSQVSRTLTHNIGVKGKLTWSRAWLGRKKDGPSTGAGGTAVTEPSINASTTALSTTQGQELSNMQALLSLAQQSQAGSLTVAPSSSGTSRAEKGRKRKLSESSDNSGDSSDSDSDSDDPFVDKKKRVGVDSNKEEYIDKVYRDWLTNK